MIHACQEVTTSEIERLRKTSFKRLAFSKELEDQFEHDTAPFRSRRLWLEGLAAIAVMNGCLFLDLTLIHDAQWKSVVFRSFLITPLALLVNSLMRWRGLKRWMREGSVAVGATIICFVNIYAEGSATTVATIYGLMGVLITILFIGVVMRIRLPYMTAAVTTMAAAGMALLFRSVELQTPEKIVGTSLLAIGTAITLIAAYSLELEERLNYLLSLQSAAQTKELASLNTELVEIATTDKLTGLLNRRAFDRHFDELWTSALERQQSLSVIMVDVDHFKIVNDMLGHLYGDEVLARFAQLLPQALRGQRDVSARYGGEEFTVLLPDTDLETALQVAERIRSLIEVAGTPLPNPTPPEREIWVTVSCGVSSCIPALPATRVALLHHADQALYMAKADGRNRVAQKIFITNHVEQVAN